ncbi:hypothetical protein PF002_g11700 [Phytophthora fragariae]|uniref:Ankyrin repeat-containing domain n=1 Tax=Phytophthora fragariae TaxID=53985 RepID=A0A6A3ZDE1_9STRA|nr:hypothetical protein PF002_g11700 [Phytophthora fragariae]
MELDFKLDSMLWTSVAVVYRECLLKRSGEQLPHVARHIDGFLDDRSRSLAAAYERTASLHCIQLLADRRAAPESLYIEWEFNTVVAQAARRGDLASLKWLAESYLQDGALSAAANAAAFSGELSVLQWLHEEHKARVHWGGLEWCGAIRSGQTEVVEWLKQNSAPNTEAVWKLAFDAAAAGYLELMQWLLGHDKAAVEAAMRGAHKGHQWGIVKWLATHCNTTPLTGCVDAAAKDGDLEFLQCAMKDAVLGSHVPVMLFLYNNYGRELCEAGICLLRDNWEDTEVRFVGMAQWLLNNFGEELEGVTMSVNRADWATNKWMKDHNMSMLEVEDEIVFWECGPQ